MSFYFVDIQKKFICRLIDDRLDTKVYEYSIAEGEKDEIRRILVLFEKHDITIISIRKADPKELYKPESLEEPLIIPLNTNYTSFAAIENQLCINVKLGLKNETEVSFRDFIQCFIIDLYVNNAFRHCNDVLSIKAALEYVPLLKGIICKTLYEYYDDFLIRSLFKTEKSKQQFEDVYLDYSRFLTNPENEKLFLQGGWFTESINTKEKNDLDTYIYKVEKTYLDYIKRNKTKQNSSLIKSPLNIRNILKRYGVLDVLQLITGKWVSFAFLGAVILLTFFILFDIVHYNYHQPDNLEIMNGFWCRIANYGLFISIIIFCFISLIILFLLASKKFRLKTIPAIFLPRLVIAIISGWILFLTGEDLMKIDLDISTGTLCLLFAVITFITLFFMAFEINNYAPAMGVKKVLGRSLLVCAIGFIVSYAFGFWTMSYVTKQFMSIDNYLANKTEIKQKFDDRISYIDTFVTKLDNMQTLEEKQNHFRHFSLEKDNLLLADSASRNRLVEIASTLANDSARGVSTLMTEFSNLAKKSYISRSGEELFWRQLTMNPQFRANKTKYYAKNYSLLGQTTTFPNMLLARALLALFIGIFFQLIIQDKSITEPI